VYLSLVQTAGGGGSNVEVETTRKKVNLISKKDIHSVID